MPLLAETIEADDPTPIVRGNIGSAATTTSKVAAVVLTPTNRTTSNTNATPDQLETGELDFSSFAFSVLSILVW